MTTEVNDHPARRMLDMLPELTELTRKYGVRIDGGAMIPDADPRGRYLVDPNDPGDAEGIAFRWVGKIVND